MRRDSDNESEEIKERSASEEVPPQGWHPGADIVELIQGHQDRYTESEWVDRGIQDVSLREIDTSDISHVSSPEDFHKVSYEEITEGLNRLETVVRPGVEKGEGGDYFHELDQQQGLDYANGYKRVYDSFYGGDAIRLEKDQENYQVINGAHRLYAAKQLGYDNIPAHVIERVRK